VGESGGLGAAAHAAVDAAVGLGQLWRCRLDRMDRNRTAKEGTTHLFFVMWNIGPEHIAPSHQFWIYASQ